MATVVQPPQIEPRARKESVSAQPALDTGPAPAAPTLSRGDELGYPQFFLSIALWAWLILGMCILCGVLAVVILATAWALLGPVMMGIFALGVGALAHRGS